MAELSQNSEIWKVLSRILDESSLPASEMAVTLAALIYLRWADFQEAEQEAIAAFDDTDYKPILPASLHWRAWHLLLPNDLQYLFARHLPDALQRLNNSRQISLATHLHRITPAVKNTGRLSPQALGSLIHWLAEQPFETPRDRRLLLDSFDVVLDKSRDKHSGQYRTPAAIAQLLVSLAAPAAGERVYDPCFGSAGLLTAAVDYARGRATEQFNRSGSPALSISGVEITPEAYIIGLVRLTLAGVDDPQIESGNSLERVPSNTPQRDGFDIVVANPPWGMRAGPAGMDHFAVRTSDATGLFIQHAVAQLRGNGRAVIVVPQGVLFRSGPEQRLRRMLLEQHTVEAVVSLPHGVFLPYTGIQASVLVLRKGGPTKSIRMMNAEPFFEKGRGNLPVTIHQDMIQDLVKQLMDPQPGKLCWDINPETLAEVEWDFTPKRRDENGLGRFLASLQGEVEIFKLKELCSIIAGRSIRSEHIYNNKGEMVPLLPPHRFPADAGKAGDCDAEEWIPYIKIGDIQQGWINKGSAWIRSGGAVRLDPKWKLKAGDILISKSGAIGKTGMIRNGGIGAIPASGLVALRPDQTRIDPHYLLAYLTSKEVKTWLDDHSRGATIRNLSIQTIQEMPVPLPPFQIQQRVAAERREHGGDALAFLAQLLTQGEQDPISAWVDKTINALPLDIDALNDPMDLSPLDRLAVDTGELRNETLQTSQGESALAPWLLAFSEALSGLRGIDAVPQGPGLLSVLQETARALSQSLSLIKGHLPSETTARDLNQRVITWVDRACSALLARVELLVGTDTSVLPAGEMVKLELNVWNRGPLPLRNLRVSTRPDWGGGRTAYLAENAGTTIVLSGVSPKKPGRFTLAAAWSVDTLEGKTVDGVREIAFDFVEKIFTADRIEMDIGGSPYVCGDPVRPDRNDVFFGREDLLEQIRRQIVLSGNVVLLEGNRRSGKSSVLWHLEGIDAVPGWLGVYASLQGAEGSRDGVGVPTTEVFREMAKSIAKGLQVLGETTPLPDGTALLPGRKLGIAGACRAGIGEASPFSDFRDYLEVALDMLATRQLGLLLMLDEFDKLQEGIDSGVTSPQVPENIRFLVQTYPRFCAILTGSRRLKRLREEHWSALYGLGTRFGVTSLPVEHARRLVTEPVKGRLIYSPEAVERSIFLTSGQPYLLQCLCNRVFDMAAQLKMRSVTLDLVDQAGDALVQDNEHFASLWDYAGSDRRRFLLALCHKESGSPDALRLGIIQERLLVHGIEIKDKTLIADLGYLRELELVELVGDPSGGHYVLAIPLMGTWIEKQHDFAAIKRSATLETEDQHD